MLDGKASIRISISRRDPMTDEKPRCAATQASSSFGSSSRTWFSTGISNKGFKAAMYLFASARDLRRQRKNEMRRLAHNSIKPSRMAIFTVIYLFP
jgi:hypothetical protein